jgi:hypothetical protein
MHPSIMWNRNFFYSLASMPVEEQEVIHQWYLEMNEVSFYKIIQLLFTETKVLHQRN